MSEQCLKNGREEEDTRKSDEQNYSSISKDYTINMHGIM